MLIHLLTNTSHYYLIFNTRYVACALVEVLSRLQDLLFNSFDNIENLNPWQFKIMKY